MSVKQHVLSIHTRTGTTTETFNIFFASRQKNIISTKLLLIVQQFKKLANSDCFIEQP